VTLDSATSSVTVGVKVDKAGCKWAITGIPEWATIEPVEGDGDKTLTISSKGTIPQEVNETVDVNGTPLKVVRKK
jgi:hypothetical protein